jgi:hypothetical protein
MFARVWKSLVPQTRTQRHKNQRICMGTPAIFKPANTKSNQNFNPCWKLYLEICAHKTNHYHKYTILCFPFIHER